MRRGNESSSVLRLEGEYWTIEYRGLTCRLRDSVGLQHLAELVRRPGKEILALDLSRQASQAVAGDAPPAADEGDARRERARVSVTRAIGRAIARLAAHHPVLGDHFATTVRTGLYCAYVPRQPMPIRWEVVGTDADRPSSAEGSARPRPLTPS